MTAELEERQQQIFCAAFRQNVLKSNPLQSHRVEHIQAKKVFAFLVLIQRKVSLHHVIGFLMAPWLKPPSRAKPQSLAPCSHDADAYICDSIRPPVATARPESPCHKNATSPWNLFSAPSYKQICNRRKRSTFISLNSKMATSDTNITHLSSSLEDICARFSVGGKAP